MLSAAVRKALPVVMAGSFLALSCSIASAEMVYNRGNSGDMNTLDAHKTTTFQESCVTRDMWEGLLQFDAKGETVPGIATSWTLSGDGKVYTFKLRDDAKWSNGDPVTADDFVFSFRRIEDPRTGSKYSFMLYPIVNAEMINTAPMDEEQAKKENKPYVPLDELLPKMGVRAIDKTTLEVTLNAPTPYFTEMLTHQAAYPLHEASIKKYGADWVKPENIVTNGAYRITEFVPKDHITLVKSKSYYDADKVKIDKVNYIPLEDRGAALKRFEAGEIDSYDEIPVEQMKYVEQNLKGRYFISTWIGLYYYSIRSDKAPFNDPKLRRALALAVDRDYIATKIWNGTVQPAYSYVPPGITGYKGSFADYKDMSQLDREDEARKIMEGLGYSKDKPLKLEIRYNTSEDHKNTAVAIANMWKNIYVETSLLNTDGKTHYDFLQSNGNFDVARATWIADYKDPQTFLALMQTGNGLNYAHFSNPDVDGWLRKAESEGDAQQRYDNLTKAEDEALKQTPLIPILYYASHNLVAPRLVGFQLNLMNMHPTKWMSIDSSRS